MLRIKRDCTKKKSFCVSLRKIQNTCVISSLSFYLRDSYEKFVCCTFGPRLIRVSPESRSIYSCAANYSTWEFYSFGRQNVFSCKLHFENCLWAIWYTQMWYFSREKLNFYKNPPQKSELCGGCIQNAIFIRTVMCCFCTSYSCSARFRASSIWAQKLSAPTFSIKPFFPMTRQGCSLTWEKISWMPFFWQSS